MYNLDITDGYIRRLIAVGRRMGIKPRGIVIGISTALVESNVKVYANPKVPESMKLPHDAVGMDGRSVGIMQQQVVSTANGWWWGDAEQCMNPETSFEMFFDRLSRRDYLNGDAGAHAQAVQGSAFPDRYGQRMGEAQALYDRLSGGTPVAAKYYDLNFSDKFGFGRPRPTSGLIGVCLHTTESGPGASAQDVANYQARSKTGSYNVIVGQDGTRVLCNTDDWQVWASGNRGNDVLLHVAFVGAAAWSRQQWLAQDKMLRAAASVVRHWCDKYRFPVRKVTTAGLPGVLGHVDTQAWGGTDHTDPGRNFPYDRFFELVKGGSNKPTTPTDEEIDMATAKDLEQKLDLILDQIGPRLPAWGPQSSYGLDDQGRERTQRDGLIARFDAIEKRLDAIEKKVSK